MGLKWLLESFSEEDAPKKFDTGAISLTGVLQRKRIKLQKAEGPRLAKPNFNPSTVAYGFCMREKVAQLAGYHEIWIKPATPKERFVMDTGTKYHELFNDYFWACGMLEGEWRCHYCKYTEAPHYKWWDRCPETCPFCGYSQFIEYAEIPLKDEEYQLSGRADGIIWVEVAKDVEAPHLYDLKTISNKGIGDTGPYQRRCFEDLDTQGPLEYHLVQLNLYMRMRGIHDAHLLYAGKNSRGLKSFHITYSETLLSPYLATIQEALEWAKDLREGERRDLPRPCDSKKCACEEIIRPYVGTKQETN